MSAELRVIEGSRGGRSRRKDREREFEELYLESYPRVYNYVRLRMGNDSEAEDVVAEAYLLAARAFDRFDPSRAKFSTWVTKIAINTMNGHWRRDKPTAALDDIPEGVFAAPDETDALADRELVGQLMAVLDPDEADLVLMKYMEGKRNVDIAVELGMNPSTVSTKLFNAIRKMRAVAER